MPITLPKKRGLPERIRRHVALRELAEQEAAAATPLVEQLLGGKITRAQANARARELAKEPLPHTRHYWRTVIEPGHE
jgi:S-adenosylmethionine:diacylglycerol 3-amino-3-carboxypropyl transferase